MGSKQYSGNLVDLRLKREKMLKKKHSLNLQIKKYNKMDQSQRDSIFKKLEDLSVGIERLNIEIQKIQNSMQNSGNWMDGDFNNISSFI